MSEIEAAVYERRRLLAAWLGRAEAPPGILRALVGGVLLSIGLVAAEVVTRWW